VSQALELVTLQSLDDEAAKLETSLADVERRLRGDEPLNEARRRFAAAEEAMGALQKEQRRLDGEIQNLTAKITPEEKRLYSGTVTNSKELQNIQHEVDLLKTQRSKLEDQDLEVLAKLEAAEEERTSALREVEQHEARRAREVESLRGESSRLNDALTRSQAKRVAQKSAIDGRAVALYEDLRRRKGGQGVVRIQGSACSGCRVQLPDAVRRRAMSPNQLAQCPNCERILVVA
jgi:predicted  nucleic acid-binding Zn-ribbon protein